MSTFEMKTHRKGKTYSNPHFFILNKGLNSGKPLTNPCPNCFVVTTSTEVDKNSMFHLSMMLQIGGFYAYYLKGSVIPFITIDDCRKVLKKAINNKSKSSLKLEKQIKIVTAIHKKELDLQNILSKMADLKVSYIQSYFRLMQ